MSLSAYTARTWSDYGQEPTYPEVSAANLNRIETGIAAVTADVLSLEAALPSTYQPLSAELSALAGLSSTGYAKRSGAASWSVVPSIPQSDVTGLTAALAGLQPLDSDLTAIAALTTANFGRSLLTVADAAAARTALGAQVAGSYEPATSAGTTAQYWRGDKSWQTLNSSAVGLGSVLNVAQEPALGSSTAGYLLSSTGTTRSWVAPYTHPATHPQSVVDSASGWITTALAGKQASGSYLTTSYVPAWSTVSGKPSTLSGYGITDALSSSYVPAWASISGKPSTFAPSAHTHAIADVTGLQTALDGKQAAGSYLPLSAGSSNPLSGDLYIANSNYIRGGDGTALLYYDGTTLNLGTKAANKAFAINDGTTSALSWSAGGKVTFGKDIVVPSITLNSSAAIILTGSGSGTYNMGVLYSNSYGIVVERPLLSNVSTATPLSFRVSKRGNDNGVFEFEVGATQVTSKLPFVGTDATFAGTTTIGTTWKLFETNPYSSTQLNIGFSSTTVMTMNNSLAVSMLGGLSVAADLSVTGAVKAGSKGIFRDYANNGSSYNYTSIYTTAAGTPAASNYSFASDWTGSYLNASTNCNLAINGNIILNARVDSINANQAIIANQGITIASGKLLFGGSVSMGCPNKVVQAYSSGGAALASAAAISLNYLNVINPSNSNVNYYIPTTTTVGAMIEILLCGTGSGPVGSKVYANTTGSQIISHNGALVTYISASTISTYYRLVWDGIYWVNCK